MDTTNDLQNYNYNNTEFFSLNGISCECRIVDILDGDTLTVIIPVHNFYYKFIIRLYGIDTCEIKSKNNFLHNKGIDAKNKVISLLCTANNINPFYCTNLSKNDIKEFFKNNFIKAHIKCLHFDKFGRTLAEIFLPKKQESTESTDKSILSLSNILLNEKLAYPYFGDTKMTEIELEKYFNTDN